jgi:hypothetical protein
VVNEILPRATATAACRPPRFNLPNDERVVREKGAKRVMLKNVQDAKFAKTLEPISKVVLGPAIRRPVVRSVLHAHSRPRIDARPRAAQHHRGGQETTVRQQLKEPTAALEEAKADISGCSPSST